MQLRSLAKPLLIGACSYGALYLISDVPWVQQWATHNHFQAQLDDLKVKLNGWISGALAFLWAAIDRWTKNPIENDKPTPKTEELLGKPVPAPVGRDWRGEYAKLYRRATSLLEMREKSRAELENRLQQARNTIDFLYERRGILRFTLYFGLTLAFASCIATLLSNPTKTSAQQHLWTMIGTYAGVSLIVATIATLLRGHPRHIPPVTFAIAALYVNACALIISIPYSADRWFGPHPTQAFHMPLAVWIGLSRFILLPLAALVGAFVGTGMGIYFAARPAAQQVRDRPTGAVPTQT
jgi:hypothetical protein